VALTQETVGVGVHGLAADLAGVAAVLEETANAEDVEGRCMLRLEVEAAGSVAAAVDSSEVPVKLRLAVKHLLLVAGPSSSWVTSWARQPRPVPAAVSAVIHLTLWHHSEQQLEAADSAQHEATSSSRSDCAKMSCRSLGRAAARPSLRARCPGSHAAACPDAPPRP
jgi:hypothetical protein